MREGDKTSPFAGSKWIWCTDPFGQDEYGEFFARFFSESKECAVCRISVDGDYTLFINGKFVSANQYADYEHYKIYDEIDITPFINSGENAFAVLVWHGGAECSKYRQYSAGVIFEVEQAEKTLLVSDGEVFARLSNSYKNGYCKWVTPQMGYGFLYDATSEDDWINQGVGVERAVLVNKSCAFYSRPNKKLQYGKRLPVTKLKADNNYYLFDLGRECVGVPVLEFTSERKQKITVAWGEDLQNGHVRRTIEYREFSFEYIAKAGKNQFINYMFPMGGRYLEVYCDYPVDIGYVGLIERSYPIEKKEVGFVQETDKKIYDLCVRTLELCMFEHYVDTPWREQCLYAYDARNQMLCGYFAFKGGNAEYARSNLLLISKDRRDDGLLSICSPSSTPLAIPAFSLYYFVAVEEYIRYTGDISLGREVYEKLLSIVNTFLNHRKNGAVNKFSHRSQWNFYDWSPYLDASAADDRQEVPDLMINLLFVLALQKLKSISASIKVPYPFDGVVAEEKQTIRKLFFKENGLFSMTEYGREYTVLGNSLAIVTEVATEKESERIAESILNKELSECSLSMKCWKYDALLKVDEKRYKTAVSDEIRIDYQKMVASGATSVWETIDGAIAFDNAGSLCHGWSAIPIYYFYRYLKK